MATAEDLQAMAKKDPRKLAEAMAADLQGFGYKIDADTVEGMIQAWKNGVKPVGGPAYFVHGWLEKGS